MKHKNSHHHNKIKNSKDDANAACNDYLKVLGLVALGYSWIKVLEVSFQDYENNKDFYDDKIKTANFFFHRVLFNFFLDIFRSVLYN